MTTPHLPQQGPNPHAPFHPPLSTPVQGDLLLALMDGAEPAFARPAGDVPLAALQAALDIGEPWRVGVEGGRTPDGRQGASAARRLPVLRVLYPLPPASGDMRLASLLSTMPHRTHTKWPQPTDTAIHTLPPFPSFPARAAVRSSSAVEDAAASELRAAYDHRSVLSMLVAATQQGGGDGGATPRTAPAVRHSTSGEALSFSGMDGEGRAEPSGAAPAACSATTGPPY